MADWSGKKAEREIQKLDAERLKAWERILALETQIKELQKVPENSARQQLRKTSEVRNKAEQRLQEIDELVSKLKREADAGAVNARGIDEARVAATEARTQTEADAESIKLLTADLQSKLGVYASFDTAHPQFDTEVERLEEVLSGSESHYSKLSQIVKNAETRRKEIAEKHQEVFGFEQEDEEGNTTRQPGLIDELSTAYDTLDRNLKQASTRLDEAVGDAKSKAEEAKELLKKGAEDQLQTRKVEFEATQKRIETLLPGALAAGLAQAYSKKVEDETKERETHREDFSRGINIMLCIALIPLVVSLVFLAQGTSLQEVIDRLPKVALATAFLYGAAIWKTAAAGKRQRLSKRLIEEYSHKEAQSRTFVGLSQQINDLGNDELSEDLRLKLLYNLVQISSENPGKLITDYKKSDHPIYELSEQSAKLASAIEKVKRVPGADWIGQIMAGRRERTVASIDTKVREGLAPITSAEIEDGETKEVIV